MVRELLSAVGWKSRGLHEAAYVVASFAFLSQLLALVRDRLLAASFGAGGTLDIYYAAFRIPDFLFATVASLLSLYALLPALSRLEDENADFMLSFMRQMLLLFFAGMGAVSLIVFVFAPEVLRMIVPGLVHTPQTYAELLMLTRLLLLQPIFLGASNILANLTQLRSRFVLYSISPLLYNLGIIFGIVALYPRFGIMGLGWGVVIGAALHMLVQAPFFVRERVKEHLPFSRALRYLREVLTLSVPRTFALASTQISLLALTAIASFLSVGSISIFMFAYNLQAVPLTIIGVSYSVAAFPTLARLYASGERRKLTEHVETALRHVLFWSIPITVFVIVLRAQIVRTILGSGAFDWTATRLVAAALALFVLSLAAQNITLLIARTYYAAGNSKKPLYFGGADILVSISSALFLAWLFHVSPLLRLSTESLLRVSNIPGTTVLMLALGLTLGSIAKCSVGFLYFIRDFSIPLEGLKRLAIQSLPASLLGGTSAYIVLSIVGAFININKTLSVFAEGLVAGLIGIAVTVLVLRAVRNRELLETSHALRRRLRKAPAVALEPTDLAS